MTGILDGLKTIAGADASKIADFAHGHFSSRMGEHGHTGRAIIETVAEMCRRHPNLVGIAAGIMVERLLVAEKHHHDEHLAAEQAAATGTTVATVASEDSAQAAKGEAKKPKPVKVAKARAKSEHHLRLHALKPGRVALEVFGGLLLLKMAASGARIFRHKHQGEVWFAPAAKIHLLSATLCAYNTVKAFRSPNVSAWRNGAILFFGTDAIKPVLKWYKAHPAHAWENKAAAAEQAAVAPPEQTPDHSFEPIVAFNLPPREFGFSSSQHAS
jgi:hypothetical protein